MASYFSWGANAVLVVIGCFVVADMANGIIAEWVAPPVADADPAAVGKPSEDPQRRDPRVIVNTNLFQSPSEPEAGAASQQPEAGPLEETNLPLRLLGTIASPNPRLARAALEDTELRERLVVEVGDRIKEKATVYRIEQRRVVLAENDALRELSLDEDEQKPPSVRRASADRRRRPARPSRTRQPARERRTPSVSRNDLEETLRDPGKLFQQARFLPKYEDGEMQGLQVSSIKAGSLLEEIGLGDGDIIVEANGLTMDSPTSSGQLFREMNDAEELIITVTRADGSTDEIEVPIE